MEQGIIIKGIGGFYYVETEVGAPLRECKARGIFRKNGQTPLAGDFVRIQVQENGKGIIEELLPRKNSLIRPPVANLDQLMIVVSVCEPSPNYLVIDKTIAVAENKGIAPVLIVSKTDLQDAPFLREIYEKAGIPYYEISSATGEGVDAVRALLPGKTTAFTGNSGVGKSSLLNQIDTRFLLETGEISQKLGRGKHTTRQVELFQVEGGGYVADTPGFSSLSIERYDLVKKEDLQHCFREFEPYLGTCKFQDCVHLCDKGCAVLKAVAAGEIPVSRHESYLAMYQEVKDLKEWNMK